MGGQPPPGRLVPRQGPSPRQGRRMAQEAYEAYGKSSPLPAPHHLPSPPGYVPPPVRNGTGGSRPGALTTRARPGDYRNVDRNAFQRPKNYYVVIVLALCVHHACLQRRGHETRGVPEGTKEHPPPPTEQARGETKRPRGEERMDREQPPPPQTTATPRAHMVPATCMLRRKGQHERPHPPTPRPPRHKKK